MPLINPEVLFTLKPAGRPIAVKLRGVRLAVIAWLNALPYRATAFTALLITGCVVAALAV